MNLGHVFQSTPPAREATLPFPGYELSGSVSIHAPREGGDENIGLFGIPPAVSIHAPREGGDQDFFHFVMQGDVSIHAPREGGD